MLPGLPSLTMLTAAMSSGEWVWNTLCRQNPVLNARHTSSPHLQAHPVQRDLLWPHYTEEETEAEEGKSLTGLQAGKVVSQASNLHLPKFTAIANDSAVNTAQTCDTEVTACI